MSTIGSVHDDNESSTTTANISGTITVNSETQADSDVNDVLASYFPNDSIGQAQQLKNPVSLGGFVATQNSVSFGRLGNGGSDVQDYYAISLVAQQTVYVFPGDDVSDGGINSICKNFDTKILGLCVALEDVVGNTANFTADISNTGFVTITPQNSGNYYLRVQAEQGARNYMIATGLPSTNIASIASSVDKMSVDDNFIPGEVIVKFKSNFFGAASVTSHSLASAVGLEARAGAPGRSMLMSLGNAGNRPMTFNALGITGIPKNANSELQIKQDTIAVVRALRRRADVEYAALNYIRQPLLEPDDRYYGLQWHYPQINLPLAWNSTTGNANVTVAVIDSGVLLNHPDLQGQLVSGYDFISSIDSSADGDGIDPNPDDPGDSDGITPSSFHGTHVAGTIAAASDNGTGVAGIGWNVKVMPLRVCGTLGCSDYDIQQALRYAAGLDNDSNTVPARPADIINLSLGAPTTTTVPPPAYVAVRNAGVIVVAAAGNESSNQMFAPAAYDGVVSVSAVDYDGNLAYYSNRGSTIDVAAPGGDITANLNGDSYPDGILSTVGSDQSGTVEYGYGFYQGTSMAAPHVAGVAALMKSVKADMTPAEFDQWLSAGELTQDLGAAGRDDFYGYGLIDAAKAVAIASNNPITTVLPPGVILNANPDGLVFSSNVSSLTFEITNGGQDPLTVSSFSNDSGGWLTVTEISVDANGVGTYSASVDRSQLGGLSTASAVITFLSDATNSPSQIPVVVYMQQIASDAGFHYVLLYNIDRDMFVAQNAINIVNGQYRYAFNGVPAGNYFIVAGNDSNSDDRICSKAEACGAYATLGNLTKIVVSASSTNLSGLNFATGFNPFISEIQTVLTSERDKTLLP